MKPGTFQLSLALQVGAVVVLFAAALGTLWYAGSSVVGREERRAWANDRLRRAGDLLETSGRAILDQVRPYPEYMGPEEWAAIDARLAEAARRARLRFPDVEGGFYLPGRGDSPALATRPGTAPGDLDDSIETQADAAFRKRSAFLVVEEVPPDTVAIRAAPIRVGGRVVASVWAVARLVDPIFLDRAAAGYRTFAGLALAGIVASSALTFHLIRTVRRQAAERDRLQLDLRRSERLAALGRLLAGVAHEVRNPLAGIRSTAQLWQRGLGHGAASVEGLVHEVDRLEQIVSSLLQFSRADAQTLAPGDLNAIVAEAARLAEGVAGPDGVRVELDLDPGLPPVVMAAPALLQVFRNLTANAAQAMPRGGMIRLSTRRDPSRRSVVAAVADTGPGLSEDVAGRLFEPFFTTKAEGTGLGLAIAREIALAHRGDLHAANRPDSPGAVFTLALPVSGDGGIP